MNIFRLELKNTWKSTLKWTIALCGVTFMLLAFFPSMQTESMKELAGAKMEGIDPKLLLALGIDKLMDFTVITNFFGYVSFSEYNLTDSIKEVGILYSSIFYIALVL